MKLQIIIVLLTYLGLVHSFMTNASLLSARKSNNVDFFTPTTSATRRNMIDLPFNDIINMGVGLPSTIVSIGNFDANQLEAAPGMLISSEQNFEAQIYGDISHLILDIGTIYAPDTVLIRLFIFVGRICSILSDYVPDHSMTFDELIFQFVMLTFNTSSLLNKIAAFTPSLSETTSFQDKRMFVNVFQPAGFSWLQYKTLLAHNIIEWSHCEPETCLVEDNESLLVTYRGQVNQFINGSPFTQYGSTMHRGRSYSYDIIGDFSEAHELLQDVNRGGKYSSNNTKRINRNKNQVFAHDNQQDNFFNKFKKPRVLKVGKSGAVLLRINTRRLLQKTSKDNDMADSTMNLYFNAMQKALASYAKHSPPNSRDT